MSLDLSRGRSASTVGFKQHFSWTVWPWRRVQHDLQNGGIYSPGDKAKHQKARKLALLAVYRSAEKSLVRPGRKQANVSVRMAWISFCTFSCRKKELDDTSRLDVVEIARVPDVLPSLFPSWSGQGLISTPVHSWLGKNIRPQDVKNNFRALWGPERLATLELLEQAEWTHLLLSRTDPRHVNAPGLLLIWHPETDIL